MVEAAGFDESKFPYTTTHAGVLSKITGIIEKQKSSGSFESQLESASPEAKERISHVQDLVTKFKALISNPSFKQSNTKDNCTGYTMKDEKGRIIAKSVGIIPYSPIEIMAYLNVEYKSEYDDMFKEASDIDVYPCNCKMINQRFKGKWPTKSRDFLMLSQEVYMDDGTIYVVASSFPDDAKCPPHKDYVRAQVIIGAWEFKPAEGGKSYVTYISHTDLCGKIPKILSNSVFKKQSLMVGKFTAAMIKKLKK